MYIHELPEWPNFYWDKERIALQLADVRHRQGRLLGRMQAVGFGLREQATLQSLTQDALKTSEIEGEILDKALVRSSVAKRLGMNVDDQISDTRKVDGIVAMLLDATQSYSKALTADRLCGWHAALFPSGFSGLHSIAVGAWRNDASGRMQVLSGPIGKERVHFQAPDASRVAYEMRIFLDWFERANQLDGLLKAGIAHLWFITIHPFEDGNGRIARALTDLLLARSENSTQRFYSMSSQIQTHRKTYYEILESTQKTSLDITEWLMWFLACFDEAICGTEALLAAVQIKVNFWERVKDDTLNSRQRHVINRLFEGFEGKLTSSKWAKLAKCSQDTASRDITDLVAKGLLRRSTTGGRSTSYSLVLQYVGELQ